MSVEPAAFLESLWASGARRECPSCGRPTEPDEVRVTAIPQYDPETGIVEYDDASPAVAVVCSWCGFIRLHRLELG